jgi:predicted Kef-type K+ transport protein
MLLITRIAKTPLVASLRTAAQLAQAGEFGLVLIHLAHQLQLISDQRVPDHAVGHAAVDVRRPLPDRIARRACPATSGAATGRTRPP